jgi:hypothetical protein
MALKPWPITVVVSMPVDPWRGLFSSQNCSLVSIPDIDQVDSSGKNSDLYSGVPGSNLSRGNDYPEWEVSWFSSVLPGSLVDTLKISLCSHFNSEVGGSTFFQNVGKLIPDYTESQKIEMVHFIIFENFTVLQEKRSRIIRTTQPCIFHYRISNNIKSCA